jgi:RHS repeat-associated protein
MKNQILFILFLLLFMSDKLSAQNSPDLNTPTLGIPPNLVPYPDSFKTVSGTANYSRTYVPLEPMTTIPSFDSTANMPILVNSAYVNGWGKPLMNVSRNNTAKDIITPYYYRSSDTLLNFLPYPDSFNSKFMNTVYSRQFNYHKSPLSYDNCAYSKSISSSPSGIPTQQVFAPDTAYSGMNRGTTITLSLNTIADSIYKLTETSGQICKSAYDSGQIMVNIMSSCHGEKIYEYTNKSGQLVCKKQYVGGTDKWLTTYYVYNDLGQLTSIVSPIGSQILQTASCLSNIYEYCFHYEYDEFGNVIKSKTPSRDSLDIGVYSKYQQLVLVQTPNLSITNQWLFTIYDKLGRQIMNGKYTGSESYDYWRGIARGDSSAHNHYYPSTSLVPTYNTLEYYVANRLSGAYPDSLFGCEIYAYNYYDSYDSIPANTHNFSFKDSVYYLTGSTMVKPNPYFFTHGKLTASKVRILDNGGSNNFTNTPWIITLYFYDEKGEVIQMQTKNPWNTWDTVTFQYNFVGQQVLQLASYHFWSGCNKPSTQVFTKYVYGSKSGRLLAVDQMMDRDSGWFALASYEYDDLGRVKTKWLGGDNGGSVEEQHYTYTIDGKLKGINAAYMGIYGPATMPTVSYASKLWYDKGFTEPRYDGKLSGYYWQSESSPVCTYGYEYDSAGRMTHAEYEDSEPLSPPTPTGWENQKRDFTVSNLSYDANGNILTMNQRGYDGTSPTTAPGDMDILSYTYNASNRLQKVEDAGVPSPENDFDNGSTGGNNDYGYDANGNMIADSNKNIDTIVYDHIDQPVYIHNMNGDNLKNIYDASGTLLQKTIIENSDTDVYNYWGPFVFKNDSLQYVLHQDGRTRWLADSNLFKYDFFVKDHQGNVRTVMTEDISQGVSLQAGFEMACANMEESTFDCIANVREISPAGSPDDLQSARLNGTDIDHRIGAAVIIHGMAGDQVNLQGYGYYEDTSTANMNTYTPSEDVLSAVVSALSNGSGIVGEGRPGIKASTITDLLSSENYAAYEDVVSGVTSTTHPRAYLNFLVFDEEMNLLPDQCQAIQLYGPPSTWNHMHFAGNATLQQNGYVIAYFNNTSGMNVWVDNVHFVTIKGRLLQEQLYYPHGLAIEVSQNGVTPNRFMFEGNKLQHELGLELSDFNARQYDQQIGRFVNVDPLSDYGQEQLSPYHFTGNDPANFIDPSGLLKNWGGHGSKSLSCPDPPSYDPNGYNMWDWLMSAAASVGGTISNFFTSGGPIAYSVTTEAYNSEGFASNIPSSSGVPSGRGGDVSGGGTIGGKSSTDEYLDGLEAKRHYRDNTPIVLAPGGFKRAYNSFWKSSVGGSVHQVSDWVNYNVNPLYAVSNGIYAMATGEDILSGQSMSRMDATTSLLSAVPMAMGFGSSGTTATTSVGSRVFWSGGDDAFEAAVGFSRSTGGTTLEMTRAGKNLTNLTKDMPWEQARPLWERLSRVYAKGAKGPVYFFRGSNYNPNGIWNTVEKPILRSRNIRIIKK